MQKFIESSFTEPDVSFELPLRPQLLADFTGQEALCERLDVYLSAALQRGDPLGHLLFSGPPGLGKTTLAQIVAKAMGRNFVVTSGAVLERITELVGILSNLQEGDVLFIDEIHRLSAVVEEYLYPAMEDFVLDLVIDQGPHARTVQVPLKRFTLVGATTRQGLLSAPLRSRFAFSARLDYYSQAALEEIVKRSAEILKVEISPEGCQEVAACSRGTPRIANNLLRWVRDYAQIRAGGVISRAVAEQALRMIGIDDLGLDELDRRFLEVMIDHHGGGPVGISTLAVALNEEAETLEEVCEPYLISRGFLQRTPRGRRATERAYHHLNREPLAKDNGL